MPPAREDAVARDIRLQLNTPDTSFFSSVPYSDLDWVARQALGETLETKYWHRSNPILRHTVLRRRDTLEKQGLIVMVSEEERRKSYALTAFGRLVLLAQIDRLQVMARRGSSVTARLKAAGTG